MSGGAAPKRMGRPTVITDELVRQVVALRGDGACLRTIARQIGRSYGTVRKAARMGGAPQHTVGRRPDPIPDDMQVLIVGCYRDCGMSIRATAAYVNADGREGWPVVTAKVARRVLVQAGVPGVQGYRRPGTPAGETGGTGGLG